jgi:enoyl-CoA hydratase/carnithine racemase
MRGACYGRDYTEKLFSDCAELMKSIVRLPKPVIARVHGIATAAGAQLVASADLAIAATDSHFATPGVNIGLFCSTPMVALSRNLSNKQAMQMLMLGELIDADTALRFGLVNEIVAPEMLEASALDMARKIADKSPLTVAIGKAAFYRQSEMTLDQAYTYTADIMVKNLEARDAQEGIDAFVDKRQPIWCGS